MGITKLKKKKKVLAGYEGQFVTGCMDKGLTKEFAENLWKTLVGFADYCLVGDTRIFTKSHGCLTIQDIVENKLEVEIISYGPEGLHWEPIAQYHDRGEQEVFNYEFEDGTIITCTPDHQFLTTDEKWLSIDTIYEQGLELAKL